MVETTWRVMNAVKGFKKATGPKTEEGKKKVAKNLDGHRGIYTDRQTCNNWKTGRYAKANRILAPAIAGRFEECNDCELYNDCKEKKIKWCPVQIQPLLRFLQAHKEKDPSQLQELVGLSHARLYSIFQMGLKEVFERGAVVDDVKILHSNKDKQVLQITKKSHPFIRTALDILETIGFTADQQNMTPAKQDEQDTLKGFLDMETDKNKSISEVVNDIKAMAEDMKQAIQKAAKLRAQDDALREYENEKNLERDDEAE